MIKINSKLLGEDEQYAKNTLYRIERTRGIIFREIQEGCEDIVNINYTLRQTQYAFFAYEYKSPCTINAKAADILAIVIDEAEKKIYTSIFDVKHNISAFSDDLSKDVPLLTAIKNIGTFVGQIHSEILHKNSFLLYYKDEGYIEEEKVGIVTSNFDENKFIEVADKLDEITNDEDNNIPMLISLKTKNALFVKKGESKKIRNFAMRKIILGTTTYEINIFKLEQKTDNKFVSNIEMLT